ncbi:PhnD/SsuA/transferrin family substrate-binding protein [Halorussus pelagicus]|uniref:PhnD/SsuA/transferrin family substrate-binding protein n=1 Tax=Halorussus pelagicus TaxID=2505977 RepID=UPI000FFB257E|nr:PhnD/SsuA/transferrin family substrate-binding protein [Halorussus pelagicus]
MEKRRKFLKSTAAAGVVGLTGTAGCIGDLSGSDNGGDETSEENGTDGEGTETNGSDETEESETVRFVLTPAESSVNVKKQYQGLFNYLEEETGVTIEATVAGDYPAVYQSLKSDQADIADASPTLAVVGTNEDVVDILGIRVAYGAAKYFSLITTTPDSDVEELTDLEGKNIALGGRVSTSGSLFPLYMLDEAGLDVGNAPDGNPTDFEAQWSDHDNARKELINRDDVVAAGTGAFSTASHVPADQFPDRFEEHSAEFDGAGEEDPELQLVAASDPIPRAPILTRSNWESDKREEVEKALLNAEPEDFKTDDEDVEDIWFTGLKDGEASDYEPVGKVKDALGLEFGSNS